MSLPKCNNCMKQMKWRKVIKSVWVKIKPIQCDNCGAEHEITLSSRGWISTLTVVPAVSFTVMLPNLFNINNFFLFILIMCSISAVCLLFSPFIVKCQPKSY